MSGTQRRWPCVRRSLLLVILLVASGGPRALEAQGQCNQNGSGSCSIGGNVTYAINITVTSAIRLAMSTSNVALASPGAAEFDATFGQTTGPTLTMKANSSWSISIRTTQATWSASPAPARAAKPAAELQWSTLASGPFAPMTLTNATLRSGTGATVGTAIPLFFRVSYSWILDTPGTYTLPVQITVTAP